MERGIHVGNHWLFTRQLRDYNCTSKKVSSGSVFNNGATKKQYNSIPECSFHYTKRTIGYSSILRPLLCRVHANLRFHHIILPSYICIWCSTSVLCLKSLSPEFYYEIRNVTDSIDNGGSLISDQIYRSILPTFQEKNIRISGKMITTKIILSKILPIKNKIKRNIGVAIFVCEM